MRTRLAIRRPARPNARVLRSLRSIALAGLLPVLLLGSGTASALYRCLSDGIVRSACCCPTHAAANEAPAGASVSASCCCKVERSSVAPAQVQARLERTSSLDAPLATVAPITVAVPQALASARAEIRAGLDPPYARPPLILLKRSLLI